MTKNRIYIICLICFIIGILSLSMYLNYILEPFETENDNNMEGIQRLCKPSDSDYDSCLDISYIDIDNVKKHGKALLKPDYFVNSQNMVEKIQTLNQLNTATPQPTAAPMAYSADNINVTFHADLDTPEHRDKNSIWTMNKEGELEKVYYADMSNTTLYYDLSDYPYGPSSYVPNYEEATKLSYYSHTPKPENEDITPKATESPTKNPLFIYPNQKFPKLLDIPAYVENLKDLDEVNQKSQEKMASYTNFATVATSTPTPNPNTYEQPHDT